jgi:hypothetical protein
MREAIELHDSKLLSVSETASGVCITIDAYIHREPMQIGGPGTGWQQEVEFRFDNGVVLELSRDLPWTILDGGLFAAVRHDNLIPLPCEIDGDVRWEATGCNERCVKVRGTHLLIVPIGTARYVEETPAEFYADRPAVE